MTDQPRARGRWPSWLPCVCGQPRPADEFAAGAPQPPDAAQAPASRLGAAGAAPGDAAETHAAAPPAPTLFCVPRLPTTTPAPAPGSFSSTHDSAELSLACLAQRLPTPAADAQAAAAAAGSPPKRPELLDMLTATFSLSSRPADSMLFDSLVSQGGPSGDFPSILSDPEPGALLPCRSTIGALAAAVTSMRRVGRGAQGIVVQAQWRAGATVAVKWLVTDAVDAPAAYMEALVAKMLAHPYIVQTFEYAVAQLDSSFDRTAIDSTADRVAAPPVTAAAPLLLQQLHSGDDAGGGDGGELGMELLELVPLYLPHPHVYHGGGGDGSSTGSEAAGRTAPLTPLGASAAASRHMLHHHACAPAAAAAAAAAAGAAASSAADALPDAATAAAAAAAAVDSFEGLHAASAATGGPRAVDCVEVLRELGAAPGKYVVQIIGEWCDEGTLHAAIKRGVFRPHGQHSTAWALRALLRTTREVALGMCHLHSLNIIHGDLKPGNILLRSSRTDARGFVAKVADFGLSRMCGNHDDAFVSTAEWGTVPYMAGEYLDNRLCKSSDVYSFGVLLWQMCTGKVPFDGHNPAHIAAGVMFGQLRLEWPAGVFPPLARLGQACCQHQPEHRPSFKELVVALAGLEAQVRITRLNSKLLCITPTPGQQQQQQQLQLLLSAGGSGSGSGSCPVASASGFLPRAPRAHNVAAAAAASRAHAGGGLTTSCALSLEPVCSGLLSAPAANGANAAGGGGPTAGCTLLEGVAPRPSLDEGPVRAELLFGPAAPARP